MATAELDTGIELNHQALISELKRQSPFFNGEPIKYDGHDRHIPTVSSGTLRNRRVRHRWTKYLNHVASHRFED